MSIVEGAQNPEEAEIFYDWVLTPEAQGLMPGAGSFQLPSNVHSAVPEAAPNFDEIELIDSNFSEYGSPERRSARPERRGRDVGGVGR